MALLRGGPWLAIQRAIDGHSDGQRHSPPSTSAARAATTQPPERIEWIVTEEPTGELGDEEEHWQCVNPIARTSPPFELVDLDLAGIDQNPTLTASIGIPRVSYKAALLSRRPGELVLAPGGATRGRGGRFGPGSWPRRRSPRSSTATAKDGEDV